MKKQVRQTNIDLYSILTLVNLHSDFFDAIPTPYFSAPMAFRCHFCKFRHPSGSMHLSPKQYAIPTPFRRHCIIFFPSFLQVGRKCHRFGYLKPIACFNYSILLFSVHVILRFQRHSICVGFIYISTRQSQSKMEQNVILFRRHFYMCLFYIRA